MNERFNELLVSLILLPACAIAFPSYVGNIPNGALIPDPCGGGTWSAVGHSSKTGGGLLTQFGKDSQAAGNAWTQALCRADSDGDGRTNGEELGDPNCVWTVGATPTSTTGVTNPAVCEPLGSTCGSVCRAVITVVATTSSPSTVATTPPVVPTSGTTPSTPIVTAPTTAIVTTPTTPIVTAATTSSNVPVTAFTITTTASGIIPGVVYQNCNNQWSNYMNYYWNNRWHSRWTHQPAYLYWRNPYNKPYAYGLWNINRWNHHYWGVPYRG